MMQRKGIKHGNKDDNKKLKTIQAKVTTAYAIRKERKRILEEQAESMQSKLDELKFLVLVKRGKVDQETKKTLAENAVLHEYIQEQHVTLAAAQAALNGHVQRSLGTQQPAQSVIHLGSDPTERYTKLMALKEHKFYEAERYLAARSQGLECGVTYCQEERLETIDGDFCIVRFDTAPIRGASVKTVFDALLGSVLNAETFLSDMFGSITIREDSELESPEIAQLRLVSLTSSAALVESNTVVFSKLSEDANGEYGVMAQDFVDYDELYPYRSNERVRRDTTTIVVVRLTPQIPGKPPVVVVTRWTYLKVHNSNMVVQNPESEIKESSVCWGDTAQKCMQHIMDTATLNSPHVA